MFESLAWASAQIHCQCFTDSKIPKPKENEKTIHVSLADTALGTVTGDNAKVEFATKPKILFCDLRLSPGQIKHCKYGFVSPETKVLKYIFFSCLPRKNSDRFTAVVSRTTGKILLQNHRWYSTGKQPCKVDESADQGTTSSRGSVERGWGLLQ